MAVRFSPAFAEASAYSSAKPKREIRLDLAGNEGRGPEPDFIVSSAAEWADDVRRYPNVRPLVEALCALRDVTPDRLLVTNGGDEAIDRACRITLAPGRNAVVPSPTFEMVPRYVAASGAELRTVSADPPGIAAAVGACADEDTTFIAIVSPNNPSGEVVDASAFVEVARRYPDALVLADLAYVEFADDDPTQTLLDEPNIVVIRTLSKAWGLAGLRTGYALGDPDVVARLRAAGGPYAVTGPSAALAARWVVQGRETVERFVARVRSEVEELKAVLRRRGWQTTASRANFVTVVGDDVQALADALLEEGILIRSWPSDPERDRFARITCPGDADEFEFLKRAIERAAGPRNQEAP